MRSKAGAGTKPTSIDAYLARVGDDQRAALQQLRNTILSVIPTAEECISYQMPAFRAFYPGGMVKDFEDELVDFETSKGTIRFQPEHPLPASLVKKIVKARVAQNAAAKKAKAKTGSRS